MKFRAVIFDMDGVLIDSEPLHKQVEREILSSLGVIISPEEHSKLAGVGREMWTMLGDAYGYNKEVTEEELHEDKRRIYMQRLASNPLPVIDGVCEIIEFAKSHTMKLAVASSSSRENIEFVTKGIGIFSDFNTIVSGDELPKTKPDPAIFIKTGILLGTKPEECIVIEDSANGVAAAKGAGMFCIGFRNPNSGNQDLSRADIVVDHLKEVIDIIRK